MVDLSPASGIYGAPGVSPATAPGCSPGAPPQEPLRQWRHHEAEVLAADRTKIARLGEGGTGSPLWDRSHELLAKLLEEHGVGTPSTKMLKNAFMSVQSSIGNSAERLFCALAAHRAKLGQPPGEQPPGEQLFACRSDAEFVEEIQALRNLWDTAITTQNQEALSSLVDGVAERFFVTEEHVMGFIEDRGRAKTYPDIVCAFKAGEDSVRVVLTEMKLSGENDSNAVTKNLEVLVGLRSAFSRPGQEVETAVALPFSDIRGDIARRWVQPGRVDHVATNAQVWALLLGGEEASPQEYTETLEHLAKVAAHRMFQYVAPARLAFMEDETSGEWSWVPATGAEQVVTQPSVFTSSQTESPDELQVFFELAKKYKFVVTPMQ